MFNKIKFLKNYNVFLLAVVLLVSFSSITFADNNDDSNVRLPVVPPESGVNPDYAAAIQNADGRIAAYESALQTGDATKIRSAALELQKDPLAVKRVNISKGDTFKVRLNQELNGIQSQTKSLVRQRIAQKYGVPESEVTFFEATNPSDVVKVGQDWDVTVQVKGKDVPLDVSTDIVHESYYEAATGKKPPSASAAKDFAHQQAVEVTNYQHHEAYGGGGKRVVNGQVMTEGGEIIVGDKSKPLRDPTQMQNVMEHKSNIAKNQAQDIINKAETTIQEQGLSGSAADKVRAQARADSQAWELEQARQYVKQFDRQTTPRVESRGGQIPDKVQKGTDILRQVADGDMTPAEGRRLLENMGETPESIIKKGTGLHEAAQKLGDSPQDIVNRTQSGQAPEDVFTENVKNRLEVKKLEKEAQQTAQKNSGQGTADADGQGPKTTAEADGPGTQVADADGPGPKTTADADGPGPKTTADADGPGSKTTADADGTGTQVADADGPGPKTTADVDGAGTKGTQVVEADGPGTQVADADGPGPKTTADVDGAGTKGTQVVDADGPGSSSVTSKIKSGFERVQAGDKAVGDFIGVGELPPSAGGARQLLNTGAEKVMTGAAVAGAAYEGYTVGHGVGSSLVNLKDAYYEDNPEMRDHLLNRAKNDAVETAEHVGTTAVIIGGTVASPVVVGGAVTGYASYQTTRALLENTETGKKIDKTVQDGMTSALTSIDDATRYLSGQKSYDEINRADLDKRQQAWLNALERGDIVLQDGATVQDLMVLVRDQHNNGKISSLNNLGDLGNVVKKPDANQNNTSLSGNVNGNLDDDLVQQMVQLGGGMGGSSSYPKDENIIPNDPNRTTFLDNFSDLNPTGQNRRQVFQDSSLLVTDNPQNVPAADLVQIALIKQNDIAAANHNRTQAQNAAQQNYINSWNTTITNVNDMISQQNKNDAQILTQKTQEAINLIQQLQSGQIDDAAFTSQLTQLQQQGAQLAQQGQQTWTSIINNLIDGQVNNVPGLPQGLGGLVPGQGTGQSGAGNAQGGLPSANDILNSVPPDKIDTRSVKCNSASKSGGDTPASITVDMAGTSGTAQISYNLYSVKDRIIVQNGGATLLDTGCTNGSQTVPLQVSGGQLHVVVQPACAGKGTSWNFTVSCPDGGNTNKMMYVK